MVTETNTVDPVQLFIHRDIGEGTSIRVEVDGDANLETVLAQFTLYLKAVGYYATSETAKLEFVERD